MNLFSRIGCLLATALLAAAVGLCPAARAQQLAVKTNVLGLAALSPNLGLEVVTGEHASVALSVMGNYHPYGSQMKLLVLQPEFRYWFNGRPLTREYVGIAAFGASYDLALASRVYQGNALALGVSAGYVFTLGTRINLELSAGTGLLVFRQKQYMQDDSYDQYFTGERSVVNASGYKIFPVKLEVSFSYILF